MLVYKQMNKLVDRHTTDRIEKNELKLFKINN